MLCAKLGEVLRGKDRGVRYSARRLQSRCKCARELLSRGNSGESTGGWGQICHGVVDRRQATERSCGVRGRADVACLLPYGEAHPAIWGTWGEIGSGCFFAELGVSVHRLLGRMRVVLLCDSSSICGDGGKVACA